MRRATARGAAVALVIAVAALLPWAFAGMQSWIWRTAEMLLVVAFALFVAYGAGAERLVARRPLWLAPAAALCAWAALQIVPLPPPVLRLVSPEAARRLTAGVPGYGTAGTEPLLHATLAAAERTIPEGLPPAPAAPESVQLRAALPVPRWHPISLAPSMTLECVLWYVAVLAGAVTLWGALEDGETRRLATYVLFASFGALALAGVLQIVSARMVVPWAHPVAGARPVGPYVNARHFAGAMEMAVPWLAGYSLGAALGGARRRTAAIVTGGLAAAAFVAGLGGQSKLATITMALGLTLLCVSAAKRLRLRILAGAALAWLIGAVAILATPLGERFRVFAHEGVGDHNRVVMWKAMLPALGGYWLTGAGYGTFRWLAPPYIPAGDGDRWLQLHNDWLESALSGGAIGFVLLLAVACTLAVAAASRFRRVRAPAARIEQMGLIIGLTSLSIHAAFDFNHQIPANALLFVVLGVFATSRIPEAPPRESS